MIYELTLTAVKRKLYDFDHVPRFINACEITCALGLGYRAAGLSLPELTEGTDVMETLHQYAPPVISSDKVPAQIKEALKSYFRLNETISEDSIATMHLGYDKG